MARIRTIKPDFWSDGKNVGLSPLARLLFIGSWNFAMCDNGHLPDDPFGLKLKVLPADEVDPTELLDELLFSGQIVRGETADGRSYLHIPRLRDHQKVDGRWTPRCFVCSQEPAETQPISPELPETRASLGETRGDSPQERKGKEGKGSSGAATPLRVVENEPKNAGQIVSLWIDSLERRPPSAVVGQIAKQVKALLEDKFSEQEIVDGLNAWQAKNLHPSTLPSVVNETINKPKAPRKQQAEVAPGRWQDCHPEGFYMGMKTRWV